MVVQQLKISEVFIGWVPINAKHQTVLDTWKSFAASFYILFKAYDSERKLFLIATKIFSLRYMFTEPQFFNTLKWMSYKLSICPLLLPLSSLKTIGQDLELYLCLAQPLNLDQSQNGHFSWGLSRWQSSSWLQASAAGRGTAETCRCHIVLVVTNPITPGSLGTHSLQHSTWEHRHTQPHTYIQKQVINTCRYERSIHVQRQGKMR